jgi:8-oxo-dGTP pyrophosphatase MutT (NUDIX family)
MAAPRVGVVAIVFKQPSLSHVLLIRRLREPAKGMWSLPGGRLEYGEALVRAAGRELAEETGVQVRQLLFSWCTAVSAVVMRRTVLLHCTLTSKRALSVSSRVFCLQMLVPERAYPVVAVSEGVYLDKGFHYVLTHVTGVCRRSRVFVGLARWPLTPWPDTQVPYLKFATMADHVF